MTETKPHKRGGNVTGALMGLAVVGFGVLWLLSKMGILALAPFWYYWPSILVLVGLINLFQRGQGLSHRIFALMMMGAGTVLQLYYLDWIQLSKDYIWPAVIIVVGTWIVITSLFHRGRKKPRDRKKRKKGMPELPEDIVVFGGRDARITTDSWEGGEATALFGGFDIDLRHAEMQGDEVEFQATAIFGGVELKVPEHWVVELKGAPVMGAFEDKTRPPRLEPGEKPKRLVLSGVAIFGGVEVKN